jgi:glyoxylase-like metal-dependent hydrolase (beta-lactamase superfamily II)
VLIDAGTGLASHVTAIEQALGLHPLDTVLITHGHVDHVSGVAALRRRWPDLTARGGGAGQPFHDGERIRFGALALRAVFTPGHSPDHYCFFDESTRDLFCGDLARLGGTVVIPASRGGDLVQYLASLERVRQLRPARLLPGHGPIVEDPLALLDEYIAHRHARTRQMLALMREGVTDVDALVARVYPDLSPRLRDAARETVLAHLDYIHRSDP